MTDGFIELDEHRLDVHEHLRDLAAFKTLHGRLQRGLANAGFQKNCGARGRFGKSVRTYHRSVVAPALEIHLDERFRLELKPFEMTCSLVDDRNYFLLWLALLLDEGLKGRASDETRIYDLGRTARDGIEAETVRDRTHAVMDRAPQMLSPWGFDCASLDSFRFRLARGHLPADDIASIFEREKTIYRGHCGISQT